MRPGPGRPALFGSFFFYPEAEDSPNFAVAAIDTSGTLLGFPDPPIRGFTTAGNRLWGYQGRQGARKVYVQSLAAGASFNTPSNWSATLSIGNLQHQINDIRSYKDQVFLGLEDGLYAGDFSGTFIKRGAGDRAKGPTCIPANCFAS